MLWIGLFVLGAIGYARLALPGFLVLAAAIAVSVGVVAWSDGRHVSHAALQSLWAALSLQGGYMAGLLADVALAARRHRADADARSTAPPSRPVRDRDAR